MDKKEALLELRRHIIISSVFPVLQLALYLFSYTPYVSDLWFEFLRTLGSEPVYAIKLFSIPYFMSIGLYAYRRLFEKKEEEED